MHCKINPDFPTQIWRAPIFREIPRDYHSNGGFLQRLIRKYFFVTENINRVESFLPKHNHTFIFQRYAAIAHSKPTGLVAHIAPPAHIRRFYPT